MSYKQQIKDLRSEMIKSIKFLLEERKIHSLEFKNKFIVYVEQLISDNDVIQVPTVARILTNDGYLTAYDFNTDEETEVSIDDLSLVEIAHIHDDIINSYYSVYEESN